jgi:hypothetical protein
MDWKRLLGSIPTSLDTEIWLRNAYLVSENRMLRQQITGRVPLTDGDAAPSLTWGSSWAGKPCKRLRQSPGRIRSSPGITSLAIRRWTPLHPTRRWGVLALTRRLKVSSCKWPERTARGVTDRIVGALANLGYTISGQTVGNILQRHSIPPAPEHKKTMTWGEFIRIHLAVLGATHYFHDAVWSRLKLVLSSLLALVYIASHPGYLTGMAASLSTWCAHWSTETARWIWAVIAHVPTWRLGCGHTPRRPCFSACEIPDHRTALPGSDGKVILLPVMLSRSIRDKPARYPPRVTKLWRDDHGKAA